MNKGDFFFILLLISFSYQQNITLTIHTESLCPYCQQFFTTSFAPYLNTNLSLAEITIVPYGNAKKSSSSFLKPTITCQHGENECYGNKIELCILDTLGNTRKGHQYISCIEQFIFIFMKDFDRSTDYCIEDNNLRKTIKNCANSQKGLDLLNDSGNNKSSTVSYVPYILVNGVHNDDYEDRILSNLTEFLISENSKKRLYDSY